MTPDFSLDFQTVISTCPPKIFMPTCDRHLFPVSEKGHCFSCQGPRAWHHPCPQAPASLLPPSMCQKPTTSLYLQTTNVLRCITASSSPRLPVSACFPAVEISIPHPEGSGGNIRRITSFFRSEHFSAVPSQPK